MLLFDSVWKREEKEKESTDRDSEKQADRGSVGQCCPTQNCS